MRSIDGYYVCRSCKKKHPNGIRGGSIWIDSNKETEAFKTLERAAKYAWTYPICAFITALALSPFAMANSVPTWLLSIFSQVLSLFGLYYLIETIKNILKNGSKGLMGHLILGLILNIIVVLFAIYFYSIQFFVINNGST